MPGCRRVRPCPTHRHGPSFGERYGAACAGGRRPGWWGHLVRGLAGRLSPDPREHGVRVDEADRFVGTSAGSIVAATIAHRHLHRLYLESRDVQAAQPLGGFFPAGHDEPSQQRALDLYAGATDAEPATVRHIGHAALAAITPAVQTMPRSPSRCWATIGAPMHCG